ncbi:MAG TPA: hypothetical protein PLG60_00425 [Acidimicrobiales bacterium]|nr:hypothetical protein [Acidimicrobiales bacterium]
MVDFDEGRGDGVLKSDSGEEFYFHCLEIADGTRVIPVGARVRASRGVGRLGHDEARQLIQLDTAR